MIVCFFIGLAIGLVMGVVCLAVLGINKIKED